MPTTPMPLDIKAAQYLYGANNTYHAGDDVYTYFEGQNYFETIWDAGGNDTIVYSGSDHAEINLRPGALSNLGNTLFTTDFTRTSDYTVIIYETVTIENATGGNGPDLIYGNNVANSLQGGGGNDTIYGYAGNDEIAGGHGDDYLEGGAGTDTVSYASAAAGITARLDLGFGVDDGGAFDSYVSIENVTGSSFNDVLAGAAGVANTLTGGDGDDTFYGEGLDSFDGGAGNDVLFGSLGSALNLNLATMGIETVWGGFLSDNLDGSAATTALVMIGQGPTADTMMGGSGDDFVYYRAGDVISGGAGNDWAVSTLSATGVTLDTSATGFENAWGSSFDDTLSAAGSATAAVMVGDTGNDSLTGSDIGDFLYGFGDNDTLTGGGGNDNLIGGDGVDTFAFGASWGVDLLWDWADGTEQFDLSGSGATQFSDLVVFTSGAHEVVSYDGNQIWVLNSAGLVDEGDFLFS